MEVFRTLCEWLNMTAMVPAQRPARVSGRYRFVSVYFNAPIECDAPGSPIQERLRMTVRIPWDASFSVGNELLDRQHQNLLGLCNALAECTSAGPHADPFKFHDILHRLTQYAREHFRVEEGLLQQYHYSDLAQQQVEHAAYEEKMVDMAFSATMDVLDMGDAQRFLAIWWRDHILVSDMQYKPLMESKR
jgi:hemerythrin